jgi:uncharacterized spore protein YtfJ
MENIIEKFTESVPSWGAKLSYGSLETVNGQEILPVAFVIFGFGGGGGSGEMPGDAPNAGKGEGSGGGGGGYALPVGAYVTGTDGVVFKPNLIALAAVAVPLVSALGWAISRIIRAAN